MLSEGSLPPDFLGQDVSREGVKVYITIDSIFGIHTLYTFVGYREVNKDIYFNTLLQEKPNNQ